LPGSGNTTTDDPIVEERPERHSVRPLMGLVLIYSRYEPSRVGQIGFIDHEEPSGKLLGRPDDVASAEAKNMLRLVMQQPGREIYGGPLAGTNISRAEVHLASLGDALEIEHLGKAKLLVDGRLTESTDVLRIETGQVLTLVDHSMYLVVRRLEVMAGIEPDGSHVFGEPDPDLIVGEGPHAWAMRTAIRRGLMARDHFFLFGPTGSGKERLARAIHRRSGRKGPFIAFNAAHLTPTLAANTLFGNTAAYTHGEMKASAGLFGQAEGGTLFLDELSWADPAIQAMLLRALEGEIVRQGESTPRRCDVLVVCATNRDSSTVEHDVLHRFGSVIHLPPRAGPCGPCAGLGAQAHAPAVQRQRARRRERARRRDEGAERLPVQAAAHAPRGHVALPAARAAAAGAGRARGGHEDARQSEGVAAAPTRGGAGADARGGGRGARGRGLERDAHRRAARDLAVEAQSADGPVRYSPSERISRRRVGSRTWAS
jgi:hypothetical protein